jgi:hypothetical protein
MKKLCKIETVLKEKLEKSGNGTLFSNYDLTRDYLFNNIYPKIGEKLPNFTYHDGSHVINVLENIYQLIDKGIKYISGETLYFLCLSTLFHDVGLIYKRDGHQREIGDIYNSAHGNDNIHKFGNEKIIISKLVEAHSGESIDTKNDTLINLNELLGYTEIINIREIAAILKFADELAEGGQRTSDYFLEKDMYPKNDKIYHRYSQAYRAVICNNDNRLAITYTISFFFNNADEILIDNDISLKKFLEFIYDRIIKLDDERKYCKYYSHWLDAMREISIVFNFWCNNNHIEIGLKPIVISDKLVPGNSGRKIETMNPSYNYSNINDVIRKNTELNIKEIPI